ncbi:calcium/sodium antiporter [Nocardiopsis exhalans]|uniref:Cation:H+ antiporter n=2 Tax=Nocardiopsis TaxID=2013 RepID=A0A840WNJ2_9ACTN|nr:MULTISPECIES: calcium/sodium antiporter [Nocardiopsis]MBB5493326.1 cation:H+ antiporter [Nocardiopsis metallicus]USY19778.1 calcium/sodium antiporter [Nocardiopsis exhalans]
MNVLVILALVAGFVLLVAGGESLVRGAGSLARTLGMSSLVVGLTVVSFTTSAPELAVSTDAALSGYPGLAVGNVVGSNIANILLVLGASAVFAPLAVNSQVVRADIPVMAALSVAALLMALDGNLGRFEGALLFAILLVYVTVTVFVSRRRSALAPVSVQVGTDSSGPGTGGPFRATPKTKSVLRDLVLVVLGAGLLVAGARLLVYGASAIATALGVSDLLIGLTVVAIGTSLPELVTCVVAVRRGERDMAVGNIVGSNVFNIGAVLGITAMVSPGGIAVAPAALRFDLPIMVAVALVLLPIAVTKLGVARWEGALLVGFYAAYITYLVVQATDHAFLEPFSAAMLWFVIPITAVWLVAVMIYELSTRRREGKPETAVSSGDGSS